MQRLYKTKEFPENIKRFMDDIVEGSNFYHTDSLQKYFAKISNSPTGRSSISFTYVECPIIAKVNEDSSIFKDEFSMYVTEGMNIGRVIDYSTFFEYVAWISPTLGIAIKNQKVFRNSIFAYKKEIKQHYLIDADNITRKRDLKASERCLNLEGVLSPV